MAAYPHEVIPDPIWVDFPNNVPKDTRVVSMNRDYKPVEPEDGLDIDDLVVSARDDYEIRVRRYRSSNETGKLPLLVYLHGGGWVTGGLETDDYLCRLLVRSVPVAVLNVEYRLAPEHPFPCGFEDSFDVVKWCVTPAAQTKLNIDLSKGFLVGGTSAGANFTAGISHLARDQKLSPPITGLLFLAGNVVESSVVPPQFRDSIRSVETVTDAPGLSKKSVDHFAKLYGADPSDKRRSPLLFESHEGVAKKIALEVCEWDPRRDEAIVFESVLREAGLQTIMKIWKGLPHGFWTMCPDLPKAKEFEERFVEDVQWLLDGA